MSRRLDRIAGAGLSGGKIDGRLQSIRLKVETVVNKAKNKALQYSDTAKKLSSAIDNSSEREENVIPQTDGVLVKVKVTLKDLQEKLKFAFNAKKSFCILHALLREPITPPVIINIMVFGIMIFAESLINTGFFYSSGLTANPVDSFTISFLISICNVMASCVGGFFIGRYLQYGKNAADKNQFLGTRLTARFLQVIFFAVMGFFHVTIGLVRSQETLAKVHHSIAAYSDLIHTPEAVLLVIIGVCLSIIAWHKSKSAFSDAYPNFGAYQLNIDTVREAIEDFQEDANDEIEAVFDEAIDASDDNQNRHHKAIQSYNKTVSQSHAAYRDLENSVSDAEGQLAADTAQILDIYSASGGDAYKDFDLEKHCSFQGYLDIELPEFLPMPEKTSQHKSNLNEAKAKALERLANLFANNTNSNDGEK